MSKVLLEKEYLTNEEFNLMMNDISKADEILNETIKEKNSLNKSK